MTTDDQGETFTCSHCHRVLRRVRDDGELRAEYEAVMPNAAERGDEEVFMCDPCYQAMLRWAKRIGLDL